VIFGIAPPTAREWLFSAKTFAASMLALYIALAAGLPRPYWAMATVFIVAHPLSGATRSKAVYRLAGTLAGASAAVFFVPLFVNAPLVLSAVVALWTGGLLFLSFFDRTPRAYAFMLAGYSLPLIALPAVGDPATVFDIAVARSQEIGLGIVCASLVNALVMPGKIGPLIGTMVSGWQNDAGGWIAGVLRNTDNAATVQESQRLATDVRALDALISQLQYDPEMRAVVRHARDLRARLAVLPPLLSSLADRLRAVRRSAAMTGDRQALLADIADWVSLSPGEQSAEESAAVADGLRGRIALLFGAGGDSDDWQALVAASAGARLGEIVDLWADGAVLRAEILAGRDARRRQVLRLSTVASPVPHYDLGLMAFSAGSAVLATFVACVIWIVSGWDQGAGFVIIAAVSCSFFATSDNPVPQIRMLTILTAISAGVAGIYLFAVLPAVHTYLGLVLVFAPTFLVLGTLITRPRYFFIAMLLAVNTASLVSVQEMYSADFTSFANSSIASVAGGLFALVWMTATRPFGAGFAARRLVRAGWAEIAAIAGGGRGAAPEAFAGRVLDRLGQLLPRLGQGGDISAADVLVEMRIGLNVLDLRRLMRGAAQPLQAALGAVLAGLAEGFGAQARSGTPQRAAPTLLARIDEALVAGLAAPAGDIRNGALQALVGLRLALFADAPDPGPLVPASPVQAFPLAAE
jgi:uncharacterized membrane protein YccC